jgi:hypothetical protein
MLPTPPFMRQGVHTEDVIPPNINLLEGTNPIIRWFKEHFPPAVLQSFIKMGLFALDLPEQLLESIFSFISGVAIHSISIELLVELFTIFNSSSSIKSTDMLNLLLSF